MILFTRKHNHTQLKNIFILCGDNLRYNSLDHRQQGNSKKHRLILRAKSDTQEIFSNDQMWDHKNVTCPFPENENGTCKSSFLTQQMQYNIHLKLNQIYNAGLFSKYQNELEKLKRENDYDTSRNPFLYSSNQIITDDEYLLQNKRDSYQRCHRNLENQTKKISRKRKIFAKHTNNRSHGKTLAKRYKKTSREQKLQFFTFKICQDLKNEKQIFVKEDSKDVIHKPHKNNNQKKNKKKYTLWESDASLFPKNENTKYFQFFDICFSYFGGRKINNKYTKEIEIYNVEIKQEWENNSFEAFCLLVQIIKDENILNRDLEIFKFFSKKENFKLLFSQILNSTNLFIAIKKEILFNLYFLIYGAMHRKKYNQETILISNLYCLYLQIIQPIRNLKTKLYLENKTTPFLNEFEKIIDFMNICNVLGNNDVTTSFFTDRVNNYYEKNVLKGLKNKQDELKNYTYEILIASESDYLNNDIIDKILCNTNSLKDDIFKKINNFIASDTKKNYTITNNNVMYMNIIQMSFTIINLILNDDIKIEQKVQSSNEFEYEKASKIMLPIIESYLRPILYTFIHINIVKKMKHFLLTVDNNLVAKLQEYCNNTSENFKISNIKAEIYLIAELHIKTISIFHFIMDFSLFYQKYSNMTDYASYLSKLTLDIENFYLTYASNKGK